MNHTQIILFKLKLGEFLAFVESDLWGTDTIFLLFGVRNQSPSLFQFFTLLLLLRPKKPPMCVKCQDDILKLGISYVPPISWDYQAPPQTEVSYPILQSQHMLPTIHSSLHVNTVRKHICIMHPSKEVCHQLENFGKLRSSQCPLMQYSPELIERRRYINVISLGMDCGYIMCGQGLT